MGQFFKLAASIIFVLLLSHGIARADYWARIDRPWTYWELKHALHYCRIRPRVTDNIPVFIDVVMERNIESCMNALGWIGLAR